MQMTINQILKKAVNLHNKGNFTEAECLYREILETEPTQLDVHNNLGVLLYTTGRLDEAETIYKKIIKLKPDFAEAHNNLGILLNKIRRFEDAEISFKKTTELKPDHIGAHFSLGNFFYIQGKLKAAEASLKKVIEFKPNHAEAHNNLGVVLRSLGKFDEAEASHRKAIEFKPDFAEAHNNLGSSLYDSSKFEEALAIYKKAIELKPDYVEGRYNLGVILYALKQYKKAADQFMLINYKKNKDYLLKCWFELNEQSNFTKQLDEMIDQGMNSSVIGSLISRSKYRYGVNKKNLFCNKPLNYVLKTNLTKQCDFKNIFIKTAKNILNDDATFNRTQSLLTNGTQTSGNLFSRKNDFIIKMKDIIHLEIIKYRNSFKDSNEGFLRKWPNGFNLSGWLVSMKNGGKLSPHMHEDGWLSGSIYINVPEKKTTNSGSLVVCIDDKEDEAGPNTNPKKIIDVVTGSFCLFPSSLLHYTIPFEADEERIVLAFDVIPK